MTGAASYWIFQKSPETWRRRKEILLKADLWEIHDSFSKFFLLLIIILLNIYSFAVQNICKKLYADIFKDSNIPLRHCSVSARHATYPPLPPISALGSFLWPNAMRVYAKKWREMVMFSNSPLTPKLCRIFVLMLRKVVQIIWDMRQ